MVGERFWLGIVQLPPVIYFGSSVHIKQLNRKPKQHSCKEYGLLTKREDKMAGHCPRYFLVLMDRDGVNS